MKKKYFLLGMCLVIGLLVHAQKSNDVARQQLDSLMKAQPVDTLLIIQKLDALIKTKEEPNWMLAANFYYRLGKTETVDSVQNAALKEFPTGFWARSKEAKLMNDAKTPEEAAKAYNVWIQKFPLANFPSDNHAYVIYDYATLAIASRFAEAKNPEKVKEFMDKLQEEFWKGNAYGRIAEIFYKNGDLANSEIYSRKAMESSRLFLDATDNAGKFAASGYPGLVRTYAKILYEEKKYDQALKYIDTVYHMNKALDPETNLTYAKLLLHDKNEQEAYNKLEEVVKAGKGTSSIDSLFKVLYLRQKGNDAAYETYMAGIKSEILKNLRESLAKSMMNKPAPGFTLKDVNGKVVTLAQFKGKTVVLDFWATWCGPCKRSFPTMQMAINKYQKDPDVQFLFIHTWERKDGATEDAKTYINEHHYDFEVLMDLKDPKSKKNKVVTSYEVTGIPTKFVIDPKGNIRFRLTGFDGNEQKGVEELSMMIEMARGKNG